MGELDRDQTVETLKIQNFLSIKKATIELGSVTALIGPQASGKSVIAKLIYFGRDYLNDIFDAGLDENFDHRNFKSHKLESFLKLFGGLSGFEGGFSVEYSYGQFQVLVNRVSASGRPKLSHNRSLSSFVSKVKKRYEVQMNEMRDAKRIHYSRHRFRFSEDFKKDFAPYIPDALFIPSARSFFSTISDNVFSFLAADERVDPLTAQFGSFYELARQDLLYYKGEHSLKSFGQTVRPILDGEYARIKGTDYIKTEWGRVSLSSASSGQQEALPLLFALYGYPAASSSRRMLVIEEPEAHLFPTAQKLMLEHIMLAANKDCRILFTTHSPYMLSYLNTFIAKNSNENTGIKIAAFLCDKRKVISIIDSDGFVEVDALDEVSEEIVRAFMREVR